eukprot:CAMPEP_0181256604 /NCGR_PEP_ID=MMETSP1096-20121128/49802_1 /TAXON_ID=156174 ORGANISM="Chrysochromulina ericina, Strain CCMP281" /NCGR_SAMPLE_ID=MMETSP1096 /ASSEMBLY_ACC=CAM_ASM_000453 /LENGTH=164 /DNA_ID=CAMNT_0023354871 /DNA_START=139 /DNA_END=633 /DNA_ORIENTATION=+
MEQMAIEIEQPFGDDANDLPIESYILELESMLIEMRDYKDPKPPYDLHKKMKPSRLAIDQAWLDATLDDILSENSSGVLPELSVGADVRRQRFSLSASFKQRETLRETIKKRVSALPLQQLHTAPPRTDTAAWDAAGPQSSGRPPSSIHRREGGGVGGAATEWA